MAVETVWLLCLLSLVCASSKEEKFISVELSCGAGPSHVVLEPGSPLLLDCSLGTSSAPFNVTWFKDGHLLGLEESEFLQHLDNGSVVLLPTPTESRPPQSVEGSYSCVSASAIGALTSRTVNVLLASLSRFHQQPSSLTVPSGGAARFHCRIEGAPTPVITWEKDGEAIPNNTRFISLPNGVLQILEVTKEDEGFYRCAASNSARKDFSDEARLNVTTAEHTQPEVRRSAEPEMKCSEVQKKKQPAAANIPKRKHHILTSTNQGEQWHRVLTMAAVTRPENRCYAKVFSRRRNHLHHVTM